MRGRTTLSLPVKRRTSCLLALSLVGLGLLLVLPCTRGQGVVESWVQRYSNPAGSSDVGRRVATDRAGNVIVAGYTGGFISGLDFIILKYSNAGSLLWSRRYNSPANSTDELHALALDDNGNIFVAGTSYNGTDNDVLVVAYSATGGLLWETRYASPSNDQFGAMAVDIEGNVIVAGTSDRGATSFDYLVIKYSNAGAPLWTNWFDGPVNGFDQALVAAVDGSGNVFVSGHSSGLATVSDFATIAYSAAGIPLWTNRFNGPANSNDEVSGMAVDSIGNVFVTGSSTSTNNHYDFATVAYSGTGLPLWTNRYNGPHNTGDFATGLVVADGGNVFVTGFSPGLDVLEDYVTIAYSSVGAPLWTNRYNGPANSKDYATAVTLDANGNVCVTGYSYSGSSSASADYATIVYSPAGLPLWTHRYDGPGNRDDQARAIATSSSGHVFVTGSSHGAGSGLDLTTIAYATDGGGLWTNRFNWPGNQNDHARAVAVDDAGNIYVTGESTGLDGSPNFATIAYSAAGLPLWINHYGGPPYTDGPNAIAVHNGKVFVTGNSWSIALAAFVSDYVTIAYSTSGVPLWTNRYNGPANRDDQATALAVGPQGNVYVTGFSTADSLANDTDYLTIAYTADGVPLWTNRYTRILSVSGEEANAIAVDSAGNVVVTGYSTGQGTSRDYLTIAYTADGLPLWTNRYNGPGSSVDEAYAIAIDPEDNVIVTGASDAGASTYDYATVKYSKTGELLWIRRYDGGRLDSASGKAVAVDRDGTIFVTGRVRFFGDYGTVAYSPAGTELWSRTYAGPNNSPDSGNAIAVDQRGNVIVTGSFAGPNHDIVTIAYSRGGAQLWIMRYNGPAAGDDQVFTKSSLAIAPDGSVIVVGASDGDYQVDVNIYDFVTIKYEPARLFATFANTGIDLWWPPAFTGWQLQTRTNLLTGAWMNVPNSVSSNRMSLPATNPSAFFRLFR